jgi:amino acid transporter
LSGADQAAATGAALNRTVTRWQIVGLSLNDVVGSGVYLLPAAAAALLGWASLWAVALAGAATLLIVLCFAEASSRFDRAGSAYLYARAAFGDFVGFEVGWMTWLARVASVASLSAGFAQAVGYLWPAAGDGGARAVTIIVPLLALTAINIVGIESGVRAAMVLVVAKLFPLAVFVAFGIFAASRSLVIAQQPIADGGLAGAALLLLYAYAGFENTPAAAGEYRNPRRDVPFALIAQIGLVTLLYAVVQWVALGTLPGLGGSETPLADSAEIFLGGWGGWRLPVGGAIAGRGTNRNTVLAGPRYLFALAADGFLPRFLSRVHPRYRTPALAIAVQTAIALPLALTGSFVGLAALSVVARLITYLGTAAAVPVLRRRGAGGKAAFRLPGGILIPVAAGLLTVGLAASATRANLLAAGVALLVGAGLFQLRRRWS